MFGQYLSLCLFHYSSTGVKVVLAITRRVVSLSIGVPTCASLGSRISRHVLLKVHV